MKSLLLLAALLASTAALADVVAPAEAECRGDKKKGDSCRLDTSAGVCTETTCSRNDYSGGMPPKKKSVPCLKCLPPPAAAAPADAGTPAAAPRKAAP